MPSSERVQALFAGTYLLTVVGVVLVGLSIVGSAMEFRLGVGVLLLAVLLGVSGLAAKLNVLSAEWHGQQASDGPEPARAE